MTTERQTSDPIAKVLAAKEDLGNIQRIFYHPTGSMTISGDRLSVTLPAGSCTPSVAADITDLLDVEEHAKTLVLFSTGGTVEIRRKGRTFAYTITGSL